MNLNAVHPITYALGLIAPVFGVNFELKSRRDSGLPDKKYPLIDYVIHREGRSVYDQTKKVWRVELVVQLNYQLQEDGLQECIPQEELEESLAVQGIQYSITSKIRAILQLLTDPSSVYTSHNANDFLWSKYEFRIVNFVESAYFREIGADETTGSSSLFILSLLDIDNTICCAEADPQQVLSMLDGSSNSARLLQHKINNP